MNNPHKKKINGYLTLTIPLQIEVDAWDEEYDYDVIFVKNGKCKTKYHPHTEEEYEIDTDHILNQYPDIKQLVDKYGFDEIKYEED